MSQIPDFTNAELKAVNDTLEERGESQFFSQFFYSNKEQFGTGRQFYDDLLDCLITTLRVQADHELQRNKVKDLNQ